ncbi:MAG: hypothetical protein GY729_22555 [Desulfobacteraceae bacterium]|nr:hypothetical protein [Desulfobacteraceae bacterium]
MENLRVRPQIVSNEGVRRKRKPLDLGLLVWVMLVFWIFASPCLSLEAIIAIDEPEYYTQNQYYFPDYGMSQTKGYASFPVFFQGWQSTDREEIEIYEWDFGPGTETDHGGRYFEGLNAYHIFEMPGIYTVRLRVKNLAGEWSEPATVDIEVLSRDEGTNFYVDSQIGDDSYDGKSMTVNGTSGPWKTATKAFQMMQRPTQFGPVETWNYKPGDRILFKRGQTFFMGESLFIGHGWGTQGYSFESYGDISDPKPLIQYDGSSDQHMLRFGNGTGYINFIDLAFNFLGTQFQSDGLIFAYSSFKNLLLFRCDFREPDNSVFLLSGGTEDSGILPSIFMVGSTIANPVTSPTSVIQLYATGIHGLVLADNTFDESGNHIAYLCYIDKALISNNTFSRPAFGRTALRITGGDFDHPSNNIHIKDNSFLGWRDPYTGGSGGAGGSHNGGGERYNWLIVQLGPNQPNGNLKMLKDIIFERNIVTNSELLMEVVNGEDIIIRNNQFITPDNLRGMGLRVSRPDEAWVSRPCINIHILDNDFIKLTNENLTYNNDSNVSFLHVYNYEGTDNGYGDRHQAINISGNSFYAADTRTGKSIWISDDSRGIMDEIHSNHNRYALGNTEETAWFQIGDDELSIDQWHQVTNGNDADSLVASPEFVDLFPIRNHLPGHPGSVIENQDEAQEYDQILESYEIPEYWVPIELSDIEPPTDIEPDPDDETPPDNETPQDEPIVVHATVNVSFNGTIMENKPVYVYKSNGRYVTWMKTDSGGSVVFESLENGDYQFKIRYLGVDYWSAVQSFSTEQVIFDFSVTPPMTQPVVFASLHGTPLVNKQIIMYTGKGAFTTAIQTDENGAAFFDEYPAGDYKFRLNYYKADHWTEVLSLSEGEAAIDFTITPPMTRPVVNLSVNNEPLANKYILMYTGSNAYVEAVVTDENGEAVFNEVPAGEFKFRIKYQKKDYWSEIQVLPEGDAVVDYNINP